MKKLLLKKLLLTASIFAVSAGNAFAQSANPTVPLNNFTGTGIQLSDIIQAGSLNVAQVDQSGGKEGISDINQNGTSLLAVVEQSESGGGALTFSTATNIADINQIGENARGRIFQVDSDLTGAPNTAVIDQNAFFGAGAQVSLNGFALNVGIRQFNGEGNQASTTQAGDILLATAGSGLTSSTLQDGNRNLSEIEQQGGLTNLLTDGDVSQTGDDNDSRLYQTGGALDILVTQVGINNFSEVDQTSLSSNGSTALINQLGDNGFSLLTQTGTLQYAELNQTGSGNSSSILQEDLLGTGSNTAVVTQSSNDNTSNITQSGTTNEVSVTQSSEDNTSNIFQDGTSNLATVIHTGLNGNMTNITQTGTGNIASVIQ